MKSRRITMMRRTTILLLIFALCLALVPAQSHAIQNPMKAVIKDTGFLGMYVYNYDGAVVIEQGGGRFQLIDASGKLLRQANQWMEPDVASGIYILGLDGYYRLKDNSTVFTREQMEASVTAFLQEHYPVGEIVSLQTLVMRGFHEGVASNSFRAAIDEAGQRYIYDFCALINTRGLVEYMTPLQSFTSGSGFPIMWDLSNRSEGLVQYTQQYYDREEDVQTYEVGYLDTEGNPVLVFSDIDRPVEGAIVRSLSEVHYADDFHNGVAVAYSPDGQVSLIDRSGRLLMPFRDGSIYNDTGAYPVAFDGNSKWGYIDTSGLQILPQEYDFAAGSYGLLFTVQKDGKCGVVDENGAVIVPFEYEAMSHPNGGSVYAVKNGKVYAITFEEDGGTAPSGTEKVSEVFKDVSAGVWYEAYLQNAYDNDIVGGKGNGIYDPDGNLTHAEIMVMVANLHARMKHDAAGPRPVSGGHWADAYRLYCKEEGIIDDRFDTKLNEFVTREEMAYYFARTLEPKYYVDVTDISFDDIADSPYKAEIMKLAKADIVGGKAYNHYDPKALVKRSEAAVFITNVLMAINAAAGNR